MYATISGDLDKKAISHYYIWQHFKKKEKKKKENLSSCVLAYSTGKSMSHILTFPWVFSFLLTLL